MGEGGVTTEAVLVDVEVDRLGQLSFSRHPRIAGDADELLRRLVGDDVDHAGNGIRAIERRGGAVEHLNPLHPGHIDAVQVDVVGDVACQFLSVDEDQDILVAQSVQAEEGTHRVGCHRGLGHHPCQGTIESGDTLFPYLLTAEYVDGGGGALQTLVVTGPCHDHRVQIIGAMDGGCVLPLHLVDLCLGGDAAGQKKEKRKILSHDSTSLHKPI